MDTTSRSGPDVRTGADHSPIGPLLRELQRISGHADTERAAADQALIAELREEITALRAAVAHLRAGSAALPGHLKPVVARAMVATERAAGGASNTAC
ncbi:hypothetical protein [Pseudonocardia xinjiangensis]|uniref:Uncharacterized protein n=1 Tax=Pseudonocardia xinjiangensis TaxID=75289 RepID=A0ABX1RP20_9PSEU|nr:hypothetical protein [Pseudonocardia xinjiangensis]NMH81244.1 hypothetical protein [Pseudonocardia xinjiangensis]